MKAYELSLKVVVTMSIVLVSVLMLPVMLVVKFIEAGYLLYATAEEGIWTVWTKRGQADGLGGKPPWPPGGTQG